MPVTIDKILGKPLLHRHKGPDIADGIIGETTAIDAIDFDTTYSDGVKEGRLQWNTTDGTLEVGMAGGSVNLQIGQEQLIRATNKTGSDIPNGTAVSVSGAQGSRPTIIPLDVTTNVIANAVVGVTTETITNDHSGYVTTAGLVRDVDTHLFTAGSILYASETTPGGYQTTAPTSPNTVVGIGVCVFSNNESGIIGVFPRILSVLSSRSILNDAGGYYTGTNVETALQEVGADLSTITDNSTNWNTAYGWGDHSSAGYLPSATAATTYLKLDCSNDPLTGQLNITAPASSALAPPTNPAATIYYLTAPASPSATATYSQPSGYENSGQYFEYYIYSYKTIAGVKYVGQPAFIDFSDNGLGSDYYYVTLNWTAVTGVDGYFVVNESMGKFYDVATNSCVDTSTGGTAGAHTGTSAIYDAGGYTHDYRIYSYDPINEYYSSTYIEDQVIDNASGDYCVIGITWTAADGCCYKVLKQDDYNGYAFDAGKFLTGTTLVDNGNWPDGATVTPTSTTMKAIVSTGGFYITARSILGDLAAGAVTADSIACPLFSGSETHSGAISGTSISMSSSANLPIISSSGLSASDTYLHQLSKSVTTVNTQSLISNNLTANSSDSWLTKTVAMIKNTFTDSSAGAGGKLYGVWNYATKNGKGKLDSMEAVRNEIVITSGGSKATYGIYSSAAVSGTFDGSFIWGNYLIANAKPNGTFSNIGANGAILYLGASTTGQTTTFTNAYAMNTSVFVNGFVSGTNLFGNYIDLQFTKVGTTVTNVYGFYYANSSVTGTVTNDYGIYIEDITLATNNYALYTKKGINRLGDQLSVVGWQDVVQEIVKAYSSQTANLVEWQNSSGTAMAGVSKNGGLIPASMADSAAANNTVYYSTTASRLVYKDGSGTVNNLY